MRTSRILTLAALSALPTSICGQVSFAATGIQELSDDTARDAAVLDIDGDGFLDIAFAMSGAQGGNSSVFVRRGDGTGAFPDDAEIASNHPVAIATGDFDEDGDEDIAILSDEFQTGNLVRIALSDGVGGFVLGVSFTPHAGFYFARHLAVGDFNEDSHLDLAVTGIFNNGVLTVFEGAGDGTFTAGHIDATLVHAELHIADVNTDGHLDILTGHYAHLGAGDGTFLRVASSGSNLMAVGDLNSDGVPDLVIAGSTVRVYFGSGTGSFALQSPGPQLPSTARDLALADFNGDAVLDVIALVDHEFFVMLGDGAGGLGVGHSTVTAVDPDASLAIGDWNGDGRPDVGFCYTVADESWLTSFTNTTPMSVWQPLGFALGGVAGEPSLIGLGSLQAGSVASVELAAAAPSAGSVFVLAFELTPLPLLGGVFAALPPAVAIGAVTDPSVAWSVAFPWSPLPLGTRLYFQMAVLDSAATQGLALSNLLVATQP